MSLPFGGVRPQPVQLRPRRVILLPPRRPLEAARHEGERGQAGQTNLSTKRPPMTQERAGVWFTLWVLFAVNAMNFFDRQILGAVGEAVRREWELSDGAMGALGTAFTLLYAFVGVPLGRLTDRSGRTWILAAGVSVWSLLTVASGFARNFWQLFVFRLGVGVGEASCAPAATSLIGDLFPARGRAKALSVFMLGLPVGVALSFAVSGTVARSYGWRTA